MSRMNCTIENNTVSFEIPGESPVIVELAELSPEINMQCALHGLKQKIADAAAIPRDVVTGKSATWSQKRAAMNEVAERLRAGQWNKERVEGDGTTSGGLLYEALCRLYPAKTADTIREFLTAKSKSEQAALRSNPKIAAIIAEIKSERTEIDSDSLLDELE